MLPRELNTFTNTMTWQVIFVGPPGSPGFPASGPSYPSRPGSEFSWLSLCQEHDLFPKPLPDSALILQAFSKYLLVPKMCLGPGALCLPFSDICRSVSYGVIIDLLYEGDYYYFLSHYIPSACYHVWHIVGAQQILILGSNSTCHTAILTEGMVRIRFLEYTVGCILGGGFHLSRNYFGVLVYPYIFSGFLNLGTMYQR